ncbi:MAG: Cell division protein FtsZ [Parcubacteria group bacterium ADurb.Bin326]|nr:MAG: Cell division protein FtsZ [Parcubacteria group bacterium ADurb.Bin326]
MPEIKPEIETIAKIKVIGVGGSGGSAVNRMVSAKIKGVDFIAINTDLQALHNNESKNKLHIGQKITRGLGAGMNPEVGLAAAQENANEVRELLKGSDMVFITCGLGGGTGTGASPVVAQIAKDIGALVVAVVTKPFQFEGAKRSGIAEEGLDLLKQNVDAIITIPNDKIWQIVDQKTSVLDAFKVVDDVLRQGIQGISEIITIPALINVDFADVKAVMKDAGSALMSIGEASGDNRAVQAAKAAISSPLLDLSIDGAKGVLFVISGGNDLTMNEIKEITDVITSGVSDDAKIIFGANVDDNMKDKVRVTLVATGFGDEQARRQESSKSNLGYRLNKIFLEQDAKDEEEESAPARKTPNPYQPEKNPNKSRSFIADIETKAPEKGRFFSPIDDEEDTEEEQEQSKIPPLSWKKQQIEEAEEEDLEIPPFLRKKMK